MPLGGSSGGGPGAGAIKAGEAFFEITGHDTALKKILQANVQRVKVFASTISNIGLATAGVGGAIFAPLTATFKSSLDRAADAQKLATRLESTSEVVTALGYALKKSGIDTETFAGANAHLQKATLEAAKGGVDQAGAFLLLGTNAQAFSKLPLEEKYLMIAGALEKIENPLERTMLLTGLFGKSFETLLPFLLKGKEGIRGLMVQAKDLGEVINSDDAKNAITINREYAKVTTALKNVFLEVGLSVLGFKDDIVEASTNILMVIKHIRDFIKENRQLIATVFLVSGAVFIGGTALAAFGFAISSIVAGVTTLISVVGSILAVVFSPLALKIVAITASLVALGYVFLNFTETGNILKREFLQTWGDIQGAFTSAFEGIKNALAKGDLALAGEIAITALEVAWLAGLEFLTKQWVKFKNVVIEVWADIKDNFDNFVLGITVAQIAITEGIGAAKKAGNEMGKVLDDMRKEEDNDRKKFREGELKEATNRLNDAKIRLNQLNAKAAEPKAKTPEQIQKEEERKSMLQFTLGDSVKGLFTSADFKGSLGLGKANEAAKKQYEIQKEQLKVLIDINKKIEPGVFQ